MKKYLSVFLCVLLLHCILPGASAMEADALRAVLSDAAAFVYASAENPAIAPVGGEWAVLGLARSGADIPAAYYQRYYENAEHGVSSAEGVLHEKKYTEYARVILALSAIGKNPADVAGYNLLTPLGDYEKTVWQGINGPVFALLALDSCDYEIPQNPAASVQATRGKYVQYILENQNPDGGWSLAGDVSDPDITGMVLQALSKYQENEAVQNATARALLCMSAAQTAAGGFQSGGAETLESCAQMLVALCELGIPFTDSRFVKNGSTVLDALLSYYKAGSGFLHMHGGSGSGAMASEQGLYALAAAVRFLEGRNSLYRMGDVATGATAEKQVGLSGKNPAVQKTEILFLDKTFSDIAGHESRRAVEALAARGIINGRGEDSFVPAGRMSRAEFAAITVRALGLSGGESTAFSDVTEKDWFFPYVNTAKAYGIVNGITGGLFNPQGTITREEAGTMVARAAALCGLETELPASYVRDVLAAFSDYVTVSDWAAEALAFCFESGILPDDAMEICPKEAVARAEIAEMLYNTLAKARLL